MEWYIMNSSGVRSLSSNIGSQTSDEGYVIHDDCSETLQALLEKVQEDSISESVTLRHLLAEGVIEKDLAPMVKYASPDVIELSLLNRLLALFCRYISSDVKSELVEAVRNDLDRLNRRTCELFEDEVFVEKLFGCIQELIEEAGDREMSGEGYDAIEGFLALVSSVLSASQARQNHPTIKRLLLKNGLAAFLVFCIRSHARDVFATSVSQILTFLYVDFQWTDDGEEDGGDGVSDELKCLIVRLLQGPLAQHVVTLQRIASSGQAVLPSENYLAWCLAFFLPYLSEVPVPISKFRKILSTKFFGYLVYQASMLSLGQIKHMSGKHRSVTSQWEQIQGSICLVMSAVDAVITTAISYRGQNLSVEDSQILMAFYADVAEMKDLWQILLFYIRCYDVVHFDRSFLCQLVCLNHKLLSAVSYYYEVTCEPGSVVLDHVKHFASADVIGQYTTLLESYEKNSAETNAAVCTLLCHIGTDCQRIDSLYSYRLLAAFNRLLSLPTAASDDVQLAEFVLQSFLDNAARKPEMCANALHTQTETRNQRDATEEGGWSVDELSIIYTTYTTWQGADDIVEVISSQLSKSGFVRCRDAIATQLLKSGVTVEDPIPPEEVSAELEHLVEVMSRQPDKSDILSWIHHTLVTASYVKSMPKDHCTKRAPLCNISKLRHHAYPILPYTQEQDMALRSDSHTKRLLHCLKLYGDGEPSYIPSYMPRISPNVSASELYAMAEKIHVIGVGPFDNFPSASCSSSSEEDLVALKYSQSEPILSHQYAHDRSSGNANNVWLLHVQNKSTT